MRNASALADALERAAHGHRAIADVIELEPPARAPDVDAAEKLARLFWEDIRKCRWRQIVGDHIGAASARYQFPESGLITLFPASGAIEADITNAWQWGPIAQDERKADRAALKPVLGRLATALGAQLMSADETLRFERAWETKGRATTLKDEEGATALLSVVGAFRRFIDDLPVLGRASIHVKLGAAGRPSGWGSDWRKCSKRISKIAIVEPQHAAKRVVETLSRRWSGKEPSIDHYNVELFQLAYFSAARRIGQQLFEPVWVAKLSPRTAMGAGQVIVVPAAC